MRWFQQISLVELKAKTGLFLSRHRHKQNNFEDRYKKKVSEFIK